MEFCIVLQENVILFPSLLSLLLDNLFFASIESEISQHLSSAASFYNVVITLGKPMESKSSQHLSSAASFYNVIVKLDKFIKWSHNQLILKITFLLQKSLRQFMSSFIDHNNNGWDIFWSLIYSIIAAWKAHYLHEGACICFIWFNLYLPSAN